MTNDFPYEPGYIGELDIFSPKIASDLERLVQQLDPLLAGTITKERIAYFRGNRAFRQVIAVEELKGRPAIVGTANISFLNHSYDSDARLTDTPALFLGSFVVDQDARGKGIATRLWNKLLEVGVNEDVHRMQFTSRPVRGAAHSFYAKVGATEITPLARLKVSTDGTEKIDRNALEYEEEFEIAKGLIVSLLSEKGSYFIDLETAKCILAKSKADCMEQIIPVDEHDDNTTALFSIDF